MGGTPQIVQLFLLAISNDGSEKCARDLQVDGSAVHVEGQ
jgi:hypothetical protein